MRQSITNAITVDGGLQETEEPDWPFTEYIQSFQGRAASRPSDLASDASGLLRCGGLIWVPDDATELKLLILVGSHGGCLGHRGKYATESIIREAFYWKNVTEEVSKHVRECLLSILTRSGDMILRPLSNSLYGSKPNMLSIVIFFLLALARMRSAMCLSSETICHPTAGSGQRLKQAPLSHLQR